MKALPSRTWLVTAILASFAVGATCAEDRSESGAASPQQIALQIQQLGNADYALREAAMQQLARRGDSAIDAVAAATASENPEIAWRSSQILQQIGITGDEATLGRVAAVMEKLSQRNKRFVAVAAQLGNRWRQARHDRAADQLRALGAEIVEAPTESFGMGGGYAPFAYALTADSIDLSGAIEVDRIYDEIVAESTITAAELETAEAPSSASPPADPPPIDPPREAADVRPALKPSEAIEALDKLIQEVEAIEAAKVDASEAEEIVVDAFEPDESPVEEVAADITYRLVEEIPVDDIVEIDIDSAAPSLVVDTSVFYYPSGTVTFGGGMPVEFHFRTVKLGPAWKGTDDDLRWLAQLEKVTAVEIEQLKVSPQTLSQLAQMGQLKKITLRDAAFDRAQVARFKASKPKVSVWAFGEALLGINGVDDSGGIRVNHVTPNSGAALAGIRPGDLITKIDGEPVTGYDALTVVVASHQASDTLAFELRRGNDQLKLDVKLGRRIR